MFENMSVDQALMKAKYHEKNNEVSEAHNLYKAILTSFPKIFEHSRD